MQYLYSTRTLYQGPSTSRSRSDGYHHSLPSRYSLLPATRYPPSELGTARYDYYYSTSVLTCWVIQPARPFLPSPKSKLVSPVSVLAWLAVVPPMFDRPLDAHVHVRASVTKRINCLVFVPHNILQMPTPSRCSGGAVNDPSSRSGNS